MALLGPRVQHLLSWFNNKPDAGLFKPDSGLDTILRRLQDEV
jgi:hypothetical protein